MLRPNKGEGERPAPRTNNKNKDKRPLAKAVICPTVVFFAVSPILLASQAMAATPMSTSAFGLLPSAQQSQTQPGTAQGALPQRLLGTNPNLGTYVFPRQSPSKDELSSRLATLKNTLTQQTQKLNQANQAFSNAKSLLASAQGSLSQLNAKVETTKTALATAKSSIEKAEAAVSTAKAALATADAEVTQQTNISNTAQAALQVAQANLLTATSNLSQAQANHTAAQAALTSAQADATSASSNVTQAQNTYTQSQQAYQAAQTNTNAKLQLVQTAQAAYDSSQVPNPNYVAPQPAYRTESIPNLLFNSNFSRGTEGWSGVYLGWQDSRPGMFNGDIAFSYMNQTVSQGLYSGPFNNATLTLSADWYSDWSQDSYSMTVTARDINRNPVGSATYTNANTGHNWTTRSVTLQATGSVSFIDVSFSGIDNGFWLGNYGPHFRNPQLQVTHQVPTNQSVTPSTSTGTINVDINEGGEATFVAPNGGTFISSNLRYEAIDDATCGTNVSPALGGNTITLAADNGVWGDPCGGWYKRLVGTLTYSTAEPQFIKDSSLLPAIAAAQSLYTQAQQEEDAAYDDYADAYDELALAQSEQTDADSDVSAATSAVQAAASALATSTQGSSVATSAVTNAQSTYDQELAKLTAATANASTAKSEVSSSEAALSSATTSTQTIEAELNSATTQAASAESTLTGATSTLTTAEAQVSSLEAEIASITSEISSTEAEIAAIPEPTPTPTPTPKPEEPEEEEKIKLPPLEDLTKVNFEEIVATDLTAAQAEQIKEAALETFLTAESGSPAYEAALEALFVAAQQDDIVVDEALAEIPGVGQAAVAVAAVLNLLSNVGADMNPVVREEAQKATVAAVIVGQVAQAAVAATATASVSRRP